MDTQTQPTPPEQSPIASQPLQENKLNKILISIIGVFAVLTAIIGGIYYFTDLKLGKPVMPVIGPSLYPTQPPQPTEPTDQFSGWKTYLYPEVNTIFSFQGPPELKMSGFDASVMYSYHSPTQQDDNLVDGFNIQVDDVVISQPTPFDQVKEEYRLYKERNGVVKELSTVDIVGGQKHTFIIKDEVSEAQFIYFEPTVKTAEFLLARFIVRIKDPNNKGYQQMVDQILSTFRFIDKNQTSTAMRKSYINEKYYHYEFNYPDNMEVINCGYAGNDKTTYLVMKQRQFNPCESGADIYSFSITIDTSASRDLSSADYEEYRISKSPITISGKSGQRYTGRRSSDEQWPIPDTIDKIIIPVSEKSIIINVGNDDYGTLSTFKFFD